MSREWTSVDEIIDEYELTSNRSDLQELVRELKAKRNDLHPDRAGSDSGEAFSRMSNAIAFVKNQSKSLVRVSEVTDLVRQVSEALQPRKSTELEAREAVRSGEATLHRRNTPRRVGLGIVGAAVTGVFLFPQEFEQHSFIGDLITSPGAFYVWLYVMTLLVALWLLIARAERRSRAALSTLYSRRLALRALTDLDNPFSRTDLERALEDGLNLPFRRSSLLAWLNMSVGVDAAELEAAADVAIQRLLEGRIVRRATDDDLPLGDEWYEIVGHR